MLYEKGFDNNVSEDVRVIRFFDSNVKLVEYSLLDRSKLLSYFLSGHLDEIICVYDNFNEKDFVGIITHYSLLHATTTDSASVW